MKLHTPTTLGEIAQLIQAKLIGDPESLATGINEIHKVTAGDITFADHPKYLQKAVDSAASFIILNNDQVENLDQKTLLLCEHPFDAYNLLVRHFQPNEKAFYKQDSERGYYEGELTQIHPSAIIYPNVVIGKNVQIGKNTVIHPNTTIYDHTIIGKEVVIHGNCVIGADAFYFKKKAEGYDKLLSCGKVVIHDKVEIGAACTIDKGVSGDTIIGYGTKLDNQVHVAHGCVIGQHCLIAAQVGIAGKTTIKDHVTIWGQVGINKDLVIEDGVVIYAQSGVGNNLESGKAYFGSPAREARQVQREMVLIRKLPELYKKITDEK